MRTQRIRIRGSGLAALATAKLLLDRGAEVRVDAPRPGQTRILAVGAETLALTAQLFDLPLSTLLIGPLVHSRRVAWSDLESGDIEQTALICRADHFCAVLARPLQKAGAVMAPEEMTTQDEDATWIIDAGGRSSAPGIDAGGRVGYIARAAGVTRETATDICATRQGWIFTAPHPQGGLALLLVSPQQVHPVAEVIADALAQTGRKIRPDQISEISKAAAVAPRIALALHGRKQICVGEAAVCQDPLRGDGTGFSLRCALLAQAVIASIADGADPAACLSHYRQRLRDVFSAHVRSCAEHYQRARHAQIWAGEIAASQRALNEIGVAAAGYKFALSGVDLVPISEQPESRFDAVSYA